MGKEFVNYACGHGGHIMDLFGPMERRASRVGWMEKNFVCPACFVKQA